MVITLIKWLLDVDNYIDGTEFHLLKEDDVKAMVPPIGLAKKIIRLLPVCVSRFMVNSIIGRGALKSLH